MDLSHLGGLKSVEPQDLSEGTYNDVKVRSFRLPVKGRYLLRATDSFTQASFTRANSGALKIAINPTVADGEYEGFQVRLAVSAKPYKREGQTVSQVGDYLIACGVRTKLSDEADIADAVETTAGATFTADLDWEAANFKTGYSVKGMKNFPVNPDGSYQSWVEDPTTTVPDEKNPGQERPQRLRANLVVSRFIPAEKA